MQYLRLYTVQPADALSLLKAGKPFLSKVDFQKTWGDEPEHEWGFERAYQWMSAQMSQRTIANPHAASSPVWAWARYDTRRLYPDRRSLYNEAKSKQEPTVLLQLRVPFDQVLISDFCLWHHVLNCASITRSMRQCQQREHHMRTVFKQAHPQKKVPRILHERHWDRSFMEHSWQTIFALKPRATSRKEHYLFDLVLPYANASWLGPQQERSTQACLWHIDPSWLVQSTDIYIP